jgi:hypothetical protein
MAPMIGEAGAGLGEGFGAEGRRGLSSPCCPAMAIAKSSARVVQRHLALRGMSAERLFSQRGSVVDEFGCARPHHGLLLNLLKRGVGEADDL